jgi:hypothetical protein
MSNLIFNSREEVDEWVYNKLFINLKKRTNFQMYQNFVQELTTHGLKLLLSANHANDKEKQLLKQSLDDIHKLYSDCIDNYYLKGHDKFFDDFWALKTHINKKEHCLYNLALQFITVPYIEKETIKLPFNFKGVDLIDHYHCNGAIPFDELSFNLGKESANKAIEWFTNLVSLNPDATLAMEYFDDNKNYCDLQNISIDEFKLRINLDLSIGKTQVGVYSTTTYWNDEGYGRGTPIGNIVQIDTNIHIWCNNTNYGSDDQFGTTFYLYYGGQPVIN